MSASGVGVTAWACCRRWWCWRRTRRRGWRRAGGVDPDREVPGTRKGTEGDAEVLLVQGGTRVGLLARQRNPEPLVGSSGYQRPSNRATSCFVCMCMFVCVFVFTRLLGYRKGYAASISFTEPEECAHGPRCIVASCRREWHIQQGRAGVSLAVQIGRVSHTTGLLTVTVTKAIAQLRTCFGKARAQRERADNGAARVLLRCC